MRLLLCVLLSLSFIGCVKEKQKVDRKPFYVTLIAGVNKGKSSEPIPPKPSPEPVGCTCCGTGKSGDGLGPCPCVANGGVCKCKKTASEAPPERAPEPPQSEEVQPSIFEQALAISDYLAEISSDTAVEPPDVAPDAPEEPCEDDKPIDVPIAPDQVAEVPKVVSRHLMFTGKSWCPPCISMHRLMEKAGIDFGKGEEHILRTVEIDTFGKAVDPAEQYLVDRFVPPKYPAFVSLNREDWIHVGKYSEEDLNKFLKDELVDPAPAMAPPQQTPKMLPAGPMRSAPQRWVKVPQRPNSYRKGR